MWTAVSARLHTPVKIFPFGGGADELMLFGEVRYTLKDGRQAEVRVSRFFLFGSFGRCVLPVYILPGAYSYLGARLPMPMPLLMLM